MAVSAVDQGSPGGPLRMAVAVADAKGPTQERSPTAASHAPGRGAAGDAAPREAGGLVTDRAVDELEVPDPQVADLITGFLPFGRSSLENAIDRFLDPFDDLGAALPDWQSPMSLVPASLAVAVTVLALDVAVRLRRSPGEETDPDVELELVPFPGLPGLWRWTRP